MNERTWGTGAAVGRAPGGGGRNEAAVGFFELGAVFGEAALHGRTLHRAEAGVRLRVRGREEVKGTQRPSSVEAISCLTPERSDGANQPPRKMRSIFRGSFMI